VTSYWFESRVGYFAHLPSTAAFWPLPGCSPSFSAQSFRNCVVKAIALFLTSTTFQVHREPIVPTLHLLRPMQKELDGKFDAFSPSWDCHITPLRRVSQGKSPGIAQNSRRHPLPTLPSFTRKTTQNCLRRSTVPTILYSTQTTKFPPRLATVLRTFTCGLFSTVQAQPRPAAE
jgi:hypothetical protein